MAKIFTFRGKTLDDLKQLSLTEFAVFCNSRARRTLKRTGIDKKLEKKIKKAQQELKNGKQPRPIRTHLRDTVIVPLMVGLRIDVFKGNEFVPVEVKPEMLGHYLGEMALSRKRLIHGKAGIGATKSSTAISARG